MAAAGWHNHDVAFLLRVIISAVALWIATLIVPGLEIVGTHGETGRKVGILLLVALIFGIVNALVKPVVAILSIPLYVLTLGLFHLVVNALMLMLTGWITSETSWGLRVSGFWSAFFGAIIVSLVSWALSSAMSSPTERAA